LREHFAVDLGDEIILAIGIAAPDLPELDRIHGHVASLNRVRLASDYRGRWCASIPRVVTEVSAKMLPSCPADALPANLPAPAVKTV
jgi:hypothetical protein